MLKVLSNQIYVCYVLHSQKLLQNIERFQLLETRSGFSKKKNGGNYLVISYGDTDHHY